MKLLSKINIIRAKFFSDMPNAPIFMMTGSAFCVALFLALLVFTSAQAQDEKTDTEKTPSPVFSIPPADIAAKAAIVYDARSKKVLFSKNASSSLPLASLTKLMTAQTILSLKKGDPEIVITPQDLAPEGDWGLLPGDSWSLNDLLRFGLVASANDAMAAAAAYASPNIIDEMNRTAGNLGLNQTYFLNSTGLDEDPETAGAYGSAYDMALLATAFLKENPQLFQTTAHPSVTIQSVNGVLLEAKSTDRPLLDIPGLVGAKTGYTDLAGGNLVAVFDIEIGHPVVVAVLGSTREARFKDVRTLIEAARAAYMRSSSSQP